MNRLLIASLLTAASTLSLGACLSDDVDDVELITDDVTGDQGSDLEPADPHAHGDDDKSAYFHTGYLAARGHEDLVRFGIDMANDYIAGYGPSQFYPPVSVGDDGPSTSHPMVQGNYETDFPSDKMRAFHNAPDADWHNDEVLANMHSTRNFPNGVWESAYDACEGTKDMIKGATLEAVRHIQAGNATEAMYWVGHATHTIQDSFSTAHTQRANDWTMLDVCTYGERISGACYHSTIDLDDRVWRSSWWCELNPWARSWSCLKEEARLASLATAGYLVMMEWFYDGYITDIDASLDAFLEGHPSYPRSGYFSCHAL